jgi:hypothetical protein
VAPRERESFQKHPKSEITPTPNPPKEESVPDDDDDVRRELESVAYSDTTSGRGLIAKTTALRALDRLNGRRRRKEPPPCPPGWHPQPDSVMEELDAVDPHFGPKVRRRLFEEMWRDGELDENGHWLGTAEGQ